MTIRKLPLSLIDTSSASNNYVLAYNEANATVEYVQLNISGDYATTDYVDNTISNLISNAPATLDTLNEIAAALGNDANLSVTLLSAINSTAANATSNDYNTYVTLSNDINSVSANVDSIPDSAANDYNTYITVAGLIDGVQSNLSAIPDSAANDYNTYTTLTANIYNTYTTLNANIGTGSANVVASNALSDFFTVGNSNSFTLSQSVVDANNIIVALSGIIQYPSIDYSINNAELSLNNTLPIPEGVGLEVRHFSSIVASGTSEVWSIIDSNQTLSINNGYFVDCSNSSIAVSLPASPYLGSKVRIVDLAGLSNTNSIVVSGNGNKIQREDSNLVINTASAAFTLIYSNDTYGWILGEV